MRRFLPLVSLLILAACGRGEAPSSEPEAPEAPPSDIAAAPPSQTEADVETEKAGAPVGRAERRARRVARNAASPDVPPRPPEVRLEPGPQPMARPRMTLSETLQRADRSFDDADLNRDGVLSGAELDAGGRGARMLARADRDGDGQVTRAEARAEAEAWFRRMDDDSDGLVEPGPPRDRRP